MGKTKAHVMSERMVSEINNKKHANIDILNLNLLYIPQSDAQNE